MAVDWRAVLIGAVVYLAILWGIKGDVFGLLGIIGGIVVGLIAALIGKVKSAKDGAATGLLPGLIGGVVYGIAAAAVVAIGSVNQQAGAVLGVTTIFTDGIEGAILGFIGGIIGYFVTKKMM